MATSSSTQKGSPALPQDTPLSTPPTPKQPSTSSTEVARQRLTPVYGSSSGGPILGTQLFQKERLPDSNTETWESGQSRTPQETPTKPTETTSSGKSDS